MKRPSRGERWSETTTRQIGFFLLPTRVRRTRTDIEGERLADAAGPARRAPTFLPSAGQLLQRWHLPASHLLHDLLHLRELLHELRDRLHGSPRSTRDPAPARPVDDLGVRPLLRRHRADDRLEPVQLLLIHVEGSELAPDPRHHLQQRAKRAHVAHLLHLLEEVVERELLLADLLLEVLRLALVHLALGLLDERHHVAHAEDPLRHSVRVEALEVAELLARRGVKDRLARHGLYRERGAAAGIAVELRQDHAV